MTIKEELMKFSPCLFDKDYKWYDPMSAGYGEDNNMEAYKYDILFTRLKFKHIAQQRGFKKPYHFKRRGFQWKFDKRYEWYLLMGKLVLIDAENRELVSHDLVWMGVENPKWWVTHNRTQYFKTTSKYQFYKEQNERRWAYLHAKLQENL